MLALELFGRRECADRHAESVTHTGSRRRQILVAILRRTTSILLGASSDCRGGYPSLNSLVSPRLDMVLQACIEERGLLIVSVESVNFLLIISSDQDQSRRLEAQR